MKIKNLLVVILIMLIIAVYGLYTFTGVFNQQALIDKLKLGLDIKGGVAVVYQGQKGNETEKEFDKLMSEAKSVLGRRVDSIGLTEPVIVREGKDRIRIELPGVDNVNEAVENIGKTAILAFYQVDKDAAAEEGMNIKDVKAKLLFKGDMLKGSSIAEDEYKNPAVGLQLTDESSKIFLKSSQEIVDTYPTHSGQIAIVLDDQIISAPRVDKVLAQKDLIIQGSFTFDEAKMLSSLIQGGALPVELKEIKTTLVNATLGIGALNKSVKAALVGFVVIFLLMILVYRLPGLVASVSLILYSSLLFTTLVLLKATLTLPGVAGLVLSIGMAVDANVIIFERLKEELKLGRSLRKAIENSFSKALRTILDANITTLIAAVVLFNFGEGPIKGFAITLMVGILLSMFTSIVISRIILVNVSRISFLQNKKLYGFKDSYKETKKLNITSKYKVWLAISLAIILAGVVGVSTMGFNLGVDFTGGTLITMDMGSKVEASKIEQSVSSFDLNPSIIYSVENDNIITLKTKKALDTAKRKEVFSSIKKDFSLDDNALLEGEQFGPSIGQEISRKAIYSIIIASVGMLIYIWFRFKILYGVAAIVALIHDVLILLSVYVLFRITVNSSFIAAILTIVGYSINDTIVIFDRVRENSKILGKTNRSEIVDISVSQTISRSIYTSLTTFAVIACLYAFGSDSIKEFAVPLMTGVIVGTYSSIFIAGPVWALVKKGKVRK